MFRSLLRRGFLFFVLFLAFFVFQIIISSTRFLFNKTVALNESPFSSNRWNYGESVQCLLTTHLVYVCGPSSPPTSYLPPLSLSRERNQFLSKRMSQMSEEATKSLISWKMKNTLFSASLPSLTVSAVLLTIWSEAFPELFAFPLITWSSAQNGILSERVLALIPQVASTLSRSNSGGQRGESGMGRSEGKGGRGVLRGARAGAGGAPTYKKATSYIWDLATRKGKASV